MKQCQIAQNVAMKNHKNIMNYSNDINGKELFVGIDTSNYTTSAAISDCDGRVIANIKKILPVKLGERGLRQSDAVFAHIKNLPYCMDSIGNILKSLGHEFYVAAVGVSVKPRNNEESYMPCFLPGVAAAHSFSSGRDCEIYNFSHQSGHIMAALYSSGNFMLERERFAAFHVSGGTTDLLMVTPNESDFDIERIGGSLDINAGQAIDRTGVAMGFDFPCGRYMESLTDKNEYKESRTKISVNGLFCNLSGLENLALGIYEDTKDCGFVSAYVFDFIGDTLERMTENLRALYSDIPVLFAGGVMSNKRIKSKLAKLKNVFFSEPEFSSDNAAGVSLLARKKFFKQGFE